MVCSGGPGSSDNDGCGTGRSLRKTVGVWHQGAEQDPALAVWVGGKPWRKLMVEARAAPDSPVGHCHHPTEKGLDLPGETPH